MSRFQPSLQPKYWFTFVAILLISTACQIGANTKNLIFIIPSFTAVTLAGTTRSGFPITSTTTTIVSHVNKIANLSGFAFVDISLTRSETNASDTCNAGDVEVRGALASYPNGSQYYVPVQEMVVQ